MNAVAGGKPERKTNSSSWEPAPAGPGLRPNGIRMRALTTPALLRREPEIIREMNERVRRREDERQKRIFWGRE